MAKDAAQGRPPAQLQFDLTSMKVFVATAELGGVTKASERLALAGAAVSRRIQDLETQFGLPLFERRKTGYVATVAGTEMAALAGRMEEDVTAFGRRLAGRDVAPSGEVRVTTTDTLYLSVLMPIFGASVLLLAGLEKLFARRRPIPPLESTST